VPEVLVTSRAFEEYRAFFDLTDDDLRGTVLDCGGGASGFTAVAAAAGTRATAIDPMYADLDAVRAAAADASAGADAIVDRHDDRFVWDWYGTRARRSALRAAALDAFLADVGEHPDRYVAGALPLLPCSDAAFDLALCSHLLFTWSDVLDEAWHEAALRELARTAREVRVFPLVVQGTGEPVAFLPGLLDRLRGDGYLAEVRRVPYRFQRRGDAMLVLTGARRIHDLE